MVSFIDLPIILKNRPSLLEIAPVSVSLKILQRRISLSNSMSQQLNIHSSYDVPLNDMCNPDCHKLAGFDVA